MLIKVAYKTKPILDIIPTRNTGLFRDRNPDGYYHEIKSISLNLGTKYVSEVELTDELAKTLIEDLAFVYGDKSEKFSEKLKEFNLIILTEQQLADKLLNAIKIY